MNTRKKILGQIDRTDRLRSMDLLAPRGSSNSALPLHTEAVNCQRVLLGVIHTCMISKASWMDLGGGSPSLSSAL